CAGTLGRVHLLGAERRCEGGRKGREAFPRHAVVQGPARHVQEVRRLAERQGQSLEHGAHAGVGRVPKLPVVPVARAPLDGHKARARDGERLAGRLGGRGAPAAARAPRGGRGRRLGAAPAAAHAPRGGRGRRLILAPPLPNDAPPRKDTVAPWREKGRSLHRAPTHDAPPTHDASPTHDAPPPCDDQL
ncbi:hypothetical protein M885DRAFT_543939, partial [Pelagophyceae sp. CCMP2097]